ncbi:protein Wnt-8a [Lepus europaeus]|uniref:protein Wnt-8a n=1 Tax=Lepus europaeus TaxID=9983 RepID=UPI002B4847E5|nr:protein Wnt-8a [Lepus europaeus]
MENAAENRGLPHPPAARGTAPPAPHERKGGLAAEGPAAGHGPRLPAPRHAALGAGGTRRPRATEGEGPRRPAARACAEPGIRPSTYRWNREAPFPGRGRFSRTRGDDERARTEAPSGAAAGEPVPGTAAGRRLRRRLRRGASPAYLTYTTSVALGAQSGIEECKFQFAWERWNCPENALQLSTHNRLRSATRETSFIHAISSAGVMHTITKNCSMGDFENCGCDESKNGKTGGHGWIWGGCSDNVEFGERISKLFVDSLEKGKDARALMNLHNNRAGRLAVKATMKRTCKCHGISGSCSIQTCWLQLADFREMGDYLKAKYDRALKIEMDKRRLRAGNSAEGHWAPTEAFLPSAEAELVFLEESPDYCTRNSSLGIQGTEGRECLQHSHNTSRRERRSCGRLCSECGLQVQERRTEATSSCNCKFHWCCTVKCDQCRHVVNRYYCTRSPGMAQSWAKGSAW